MPWCAAGRHGGDLPALVAEAYVGQGGAKMASPDSQIPDSPGIAVGDWVARTARLCSAVDVKVSSYLRPLGWHRPLGKERGTKPSCWMLLCNSTLPGPQAHQALWGPGCSAEKTFLRGGHASAAFWVRGERQWFGMISHPVGHDAVEMAQPSCRRCGWHLTGRHGSCPSRGEGNGLINPDVLADHGPVSYTNPRPPSPVLSYSV